jgi:hypothetical protein
MLKTFVFITIILSVFLLLNACGTKEQSDPHLNSNFKCLQTQGKFAVMANSNDNDNAEELLVEIERLAILTNSNNKTHIHLDSIGGFCASNIKIKSNYTVDTLKLEEYWDENEGRINTACSCILSLDLTLESKYDDVKYLAYTYDHGGSQIFQVRYELHE